ncbi:MAG: hypothetical protein R3F39_25115 [Myxococcota bacterium]
MFCEDIDHAERMRSRTGQFRSRRASRNADDHALRRPYHRDSEDGKRLVDAFVSVNSRYPVIATTSKLLTTGVDAPTCKLIVLDQTIASMIEFKQIIGRGCWPSTRGHRQETSSP